MEQPRILFVDAYDSFSNNIIALLEDHLGINTTKISIDAAIPSLPDFLSHYSAVVMGPGPGTPDRPTDVGLMHDVWELADENLLPVLGICLGFQSLVLAFGGSVARLRQPRHGIETKVRCMGEGLFQGLTSVRAVQYHSLHVMMGHDADAAWDEVGEGALWRSSERCPELVPLAWDFREPQGTVDGDDGKVGGWRQNPKAILMAVKHAVKPFFGVQFHPESVCSSENARQTVLNWWGIAQEWNREHRSSKPTLTNGFPRPHPLLVGDEKGDSHEQKVDLISNPTPLESQHRVPSLLPKLHPSVQHKDIEVGNLDVPAICERLGLTTEPGTEWVVLDSEKRQSQGLGKTTIIGLVPPDTLKVSYTTGSGYANLSRDNEAASESLQNHGSSIFSYLKSMVECCHVEYSQSNETSPFWGGLMGYITYEAGLETIGVPTQKNPPNRPDLSFAFVERSIIIKHLERTVTVQSIRRDDQGWVQEASLRLNDKSASNDESPSGIVPPPAKHVRFPSQTVYCSKIAECQEEIQAGESYELCLTDQTTILTSTRDNISAWSHYLHLRNCNPAPFAAFIRLGPLSLLSSSPERFLKWSRPVPAKYALNDVGLPQPSICQFRPIKGTVAKYVRESGTDGPTRRVTLEEATAQLHTQKEIAENLMIADLIRHDLHGVVGAGNVRTAALMSVEEYESVYQLVTVIEGTLPLPTSLLEETKTSKDHMSMIEKPCVSSHTTIDATNVSNGNRRKLDHYSPTITTEPAGKRRKLESNGDSEPKHHTEFDVRTQANSESQTTTQAKNNGGTKPNPSAEPTPSSKPNISTTPDSSSRSPSTTPPTGINLLASSLPPGSMTGAPKLRSCQLLSRIEQHVPRSVYAGVLGYMDVGGGGDFSVVIRTAWRWDEEGETKGGSKGEEDGGEQGEEEWKCGGSELGERSRA